MRVRDGKKIAHEGIKVEFVGSIGALALSPVLKGPSNPPPQSSSTTGVTITNFCHSRRSSPRQGRCGKPRHLISCLRTSRSSTKVTRGLM